MHGSGRRRRMRLTMAITCAGLLALSACGGSSKAKDNGRDTSGDAAILGSTSPATGAEIKIGFVTDGKSSTIDNTPELDAAKATVAYLNKYKGGIGGHTINLDTCETKQDPGTAAACGQQMVNDKVVAVLEGVTGQGASVFDPLATANVPVFAYAAIDQKVLLSPKAFVMGNGIGTAAGAPIYVAQKSGFTKAGALSSDVPSAFQQVQAFSMFYDKLHISYKAVGVSLDTADFAPKVQQLIDFKAQQVELVGDTNFCSSAITALKNAAYTGKIIIIPQCLGENSSKDVGPGGYKGMILSTATTTDPSDPDLKLFNAVMNTFSSATPRGGVSDGGFIAVKGFADAMAGYSGDFTTAGVAKALSTMPKPIPVPMGGGVTFQCGSNPYSVLPAICSYATLTADLNEDGSATNFQQIDTRSVASL